MGKAKAKAKGASKASGRATANVDPDPELALPCIDEQHAFLDAAKHYDFTTVRKLVEENGLYVNVQPDGRWSALQQAAEAGDVLVEEFLLENGANLDSKTKDDKPPLDVSHADCADLLRPLKEESKRTVADATPPAKRAKLDQEVPAESTANDNLPKEEEEEDEEKNLATPAKSKRRTKRKAQEVEVNGRTQVEVLCPKCRENKVGETAKQQTLAGFFGGGNKAKPVEATQASEQHEFTEKRVEPPSHGGAEGTEQFALDAPSAGPASFSHGASKDGEGTASNMLFCSRCLKPMHDLRFASTDHKRHKGAKGGCPFADRLKRYKDTAKSSNVLWGLTDDQAMDLMRQPCTLCGENPDLMLGKINGISRLRNNDGQRSMGPYTPTNTTTACGVCNMMKGTHNLEEIMQICSTIATHHGLGDFGRFPDAFCDNTSKRARSSYFADNKTHALTNAQFDEIVALPCHYCGKEPQKGKHHNGLDRVDNSVRVYTQSTCVSCCGTCNITKNRNSIELFLRKCKIIAEKADIVGQDGHSAIP